MEVTVSEQVQTALVKFNAGPVTPQQFARHLGFTERGMYFLEVFQPSVFNKSWIFLSPTMIKEWFCKNDTSKDAVGNFYKNVLFNYELNSEYKEVDLNDPEVVKWQTSNLKIQRGGKKPRFFYATGACVKDIGLLRNKEIRGHYMDVEEVFYKMGEYYLQSQVIVINKKMTAQITMTEETRAEVEKQKQIAQAAQFKAETEQKNAENARADANAEKLKTDEANKRAADAKEETDRVATDAAAKLKAAADELEEAKKQTTRVNAHIGITQEYHELETFYINTSLDDHDKKLYKPGHVASLEVKSFRDRLTTYNTRGIDRSLYFPVYVKQVYNAHQFDARVKAAISLFKSKKNKNKEILVIDLEDLIEICDYLAAHSNDDMEYINKFARERFVQGIARPVKDVQAIDIELVTIPAMKKKLVTEYTRAELMQTATSTIELYMRKQNDDEKWSMSIGLTGETIHWSEISEILMELLDVKRPKLCATVWTKLFKELAKLHKFQFVHHTRKAAADESPVAEPDQAEVAPHADDTHTGESPDV
jgi:hypothetical protein